MNVMKLVQEVRGMAQLAEWSPATRPMGPLPLDLHPQARRPKPAKRKLFIHIHSLEGPDIPTTVPIHRSPGEEEEA